MSILKTCPYCGGRGYINQFEVVEGGFRAWSNECIACKGTGSILFPETNANRIRAMSDKELAEWAINKAPNIGKRYTDSRLGLLDWLQQPAEEDT